MTTNEWLAARLAAGLTQREVERRCGFGTHGWLSQVERGIAPTPEQEARLRAVLEAARETQAELREMWGS